MDEPSTDGVRTPWGTQTTLAIENFPVSGRGLPDELISALLRLKSACAQVNAKRRIVDRDVAEAIVASVEELLASPRPDWFPVDVFQTGSGTSTNMNVNEVLATLAADRVGRSVHPNDEVNASQSSNDVFPSAIRLAAIGLVVDRVVPSLETLERSLRRLAAAHPDLVTTGRTHLMDAVPIRFADEVGGWARAVRLGVERLVDMLGRLGELPLGGTATGSGLNTPKGFGHDVAALLAGELQLPLREAVDHFEAQGAQDALVEASGAIKVVALSLHKIAGDLRLLGSGPATGLRELQIPELQAGSSIMPGKVNPVIPEAVQQVAAQVVGNDAAISFAATLSTLQLNTAMPVMARNLLESLALVANVSRLLAERCVAGIVPSAEVMRRYAESSPAIVTALNPTIGYSAGSKIAKRAIAEGRTIREIALEDGVEAGVLDAALDVAKMADGG
ncbi:MAG: class II fumarate hydratase [Ilumatobacteraceae bacterium]